MGGVKPWRFSDEQLQKMKNLQDNFDDMLAVSSKLVDSLSKEFNEIKHLMKLSRNLNPSPEIHVLNDSCSVNKMNAVLGRTFI